MATNLCNLIVTSSLLPKYKIWLSHSELMILLEKGRQYLMCFVREMNLGR